MVSSSPISYGANGNRKTASVVATPGIAPRRLCWCNRSFFPFALFVSARNASSSICCCNVPGICPAIALRTSASVSLRSLTNAGTRSRLTTSSSTAFAIWTRLAHAMSHCFPNAPSQNGLQPCIAPSSSCPRTNSAERSARLRDSTAAPWVLPRRSR
jgi:hypothetical protein